MRRTLSLIISMVILVTALISCENETVNTALPTVTEEIYDDLYMTIALDAEKYEVGDVVTATVTVENKGSADIALMRAVTDIDYAVCLDDDFSSSTDKFISVTFADGGVTRNDLLPYKDYTEFPMDDNIIEKNEKLTRIVEFYLDGTSYYSAPSMSTEWTVTGSVKVKTGDEDEFGDSWERRSATIVVPHDVVENPLCSVSDSQGNSLSVTLKKPHFKAIETVVADITFTNGGDAPLLLYKKSDGEFSFDAKLSRNGELQQELIGGFSDEYKAFTVVSAGESTTVTVMLPMERNDLGQLESYDPAAEYILSANVWYKEERKSGAVPQSIAVEMPVPHERTKTQLYKEAKGAYFSRLRTTVDDKEYNVGDELAATFEFFCIGEDYYLWDYLDSEGRVLGNFKVQLLEGDRVVKEEYYLSVSGLQENGTTLIANVVFDTAELKAYKPWTLVFTVSSCAEKDMEGIGFEERLVILEIPHKGYYD